MILRIVRAKVCGPHVLDLTFNDGLRKRVNVEPLLTGPIFEPLQSPGIFSQAILDTESGTVVWPNGADIAPEALHELESQPRPKATAPDRRRSKAKLQKTTE
jgi:hypothetical protein